MSSPSSPSDDPGSEGTATSPFPLNPELYVFDPSSFASHHELVAALWRTGVGAVAELGDARPSPWGQQVRQFGVAWVQLGPVSEQSLRRLAAGCRRFRLAAAVEDQVDLQRHLGAHPLFRRLPFSLLPAGSPSAPC
jgi:hypothetical protein